MTKQQLACLIQTSGAEMRDNTNWRLSACPTSGVHPSSSSSLDLLLYLATTCICCATTLFCPICFRITISVLKTFLTTPVPIFRRFSEGFGHGCNLTIFFRFGHLKKIWCAFVDAQFS